MNNWETLFDTFISALISTFPENTLIPVYRDNLMGLRNKGLGMPIVKHVLSYIEPYFDKISRCDSTLFDSEEPVYLLKAIDFRPLFKQSSPNTQVSIWTYLQSIYITGKMLLNQEVSTNIVKPEIPKDSDIQEGMDLIHGMIKDIDIESVFGSFISQDPKNMNLGNMMSNLMNNPDAVKGIESSLKGKLESGNIDLNKVRGAANILMTKLQQGDFSEIERMVSGESSKKKNRKRNGSA